MKMKANETKEVVNEIALERKASGKSERSDGGSMRGEAARRASAARGGERDRVASAKGESAKSDGSPLSSIDVSYYKSRLARVEEKLAKESAKVKSTVKYYEEQFEQQAKKLYAQAEAEQAELSEECSKLKAQVEWLKTTQETLKSERAAREGLEKELRALREDGDKTKSAASSDVSALEIERLKSEVVRLKEQMELSTTKAKAVAEDGTEVKILQDQLDAEKAKSAKAEKQLEAMREDFIDPAEFGLVQKKLYVAESTLAKTQAQLEQSRSSVDENQQIKARLDVAEKLVFSLKDKAKRVDELEKHALDAVRDQDSLRDAYAKLQTMTDKVLAISSEKEVLLRSVAQSAHIEAQLTETRQELNRTQSVLNAAQVDKTNVEMNCKYVIDDVGRMLRDQIVSATRWDARMIAEIDEANAEHAEIRRNTLTLVASAEAEAKKALRESVDMVHSARRALQDGHKKSEQIIEDVIRQDRHRVSDEAMAMKSELVETKRRLIKANSEIDDLSEQVRELRIQSHLAKDVHAAAMATSSAAPSVDTARGYDSEDPLPQYAKQESDTYRRKLRVVQLQLLVTKALKASQISVTEPSLERATLDEVESIMEVLRTERETLKGENARLRLEIMALKSAPTQTSEDVSEIEHLLHSRNELMQQLEVATDELERSRVRIEKLETEKSNSKKSKIEREDELAAALIAAKHEVETTEHALKQLKLAHVKALESVADDVGTTAKAKMDDLRQELLASNAMREKTSAALSIVEDELTVSRSERDDALNNLQIVKEELSQMRLTLKDMASSRTEILGAGQKEVKARDKELLAVRQELVAVKSEREILSAEIDKLKSKVVDAHSRLSDFENQKSQWESIESDRTKSSNSVTKLEDELIIVASERDALQTELQVAQAERDRLRKELESLLAKLSMSEESTKSELTQSRADVILAKESLAAAQDELEAMRKSYVESVKENENQRIDVKVANKSLEKAREELGEREVELKLALKAAEDREAARAEAAFLVEKATVDLGTTRAQLEKTESELVSLVDVVERVQAEAQAFEDKIAQIQQHVAMTEERLEESLKNADQLHAERDVANETLAKARNELAKAQAQSRLQDARLIELQLQFDTLTNDFKEKSNELVVTEAFLQKSVAAIDKHRAESDGAERALDILSDELSTTQSKLEAASTQLVEVYKKEEVQNAEMVQLRVSLDAVIDKFKILRDAHEETLERLDYEIFERQRENDEHENYKGESDQNLQLLIKSLEKAREELGEREVELKFALKTAEDREAARAETASLVEKATVDLGTTRAQLEKTESDLTSAVAIIERGQAEVQAFEDRIAQIQQHVVMTEERLKESLKNADRLQAERDTANEALTKTKQELSKNAEQLHQELDFANETLVEARNELAKAQAQSRLQDARLIELQLQFDTLTNDFKEKSNELALTEANLQKSIAADKDRAESDSSEQALDILRKDLSTTQAKLETASTQLARVYVEVMEYRQKEEQENAELMELHLSFDAVIDKFKILQGAHEETLERLEDEVTERQRENEEHAKYQDEYDQHLQLLKKAASAKTEFEALANELHGVLSEMERAIDDAQLAGNEADKRTAAAANKNKKKQSQRPDPSVSLVAVEALARVKTPLDNLRKSLAKVMSSQAEALLENNSIDKDTAERDASERALDILRKELSMTNAKLLAASAQLAEVYEEVTEYRRKEEVENAELVELRTNLDEVIMKFQILQDAHEVTLERLEYEVTERQRENDARLVPQRPTSSV